jgi:glutaminase
MLRDENYTINKIGIFNVLNGKLMIADISKWNKGKELFEYLLNLQEKILAKDHKLESEIMKKPSLLRYHRRKFVKIYVKDFGFVETNVNVSLISYAKILGKMNAYNFLKNLKRNLRGIIVTPERSRSRNRR